MKNRLLVAIICIPALILVFFFCPPWVLALLIAALSAIAVHEVLSSTGMVQKRRIYVYAMIFAALVPLWFYVNGSAFYGFLGIFALICLFFAEALHSCGSMKISSLTGALFFALFIPLTLSAFVRLRQHELWLFHVFMPIVIAFTSDAGGLFAGMLFGKHKLAPEISPKKTVEGAIGAIVFAVFFALLGGVLGDNLAGYSVNYLYLIIYGVVGSIVSQFGDLCFSYIKREYSIKDFGYILPGHGGVLDRFDSVIFCAPLYEFMIVLLPAVVLL